MQVMTLWNNMKQNFIIDVEYYLKIAQTNHVYYTIMLLFVLAFAGANHQMKIQNYFYIYFTFPD